MQYIRDYYGVAVKRGTRLKFRGLPYIVIGSKDQYLRIRPCPPDSPDGNQFRGDVTIHPTWEVEYEW